MTSDYLNRPTCSEIDAAADRQRAVERFVQQHVQCCLSGIVSTLATGYGAIPQMRVDGCEDLSRLAEQAYDLAAPYPDYEEIARECGWYRQSDQRWYHPDGDYADSPEEACEAHEIDVHDYGIYHEPFEFWAVSAYLALELEKHGEKVDRDFEGLCVWARTTTGQAISMDGVIQRIYAELLSA
jgi:hypothetical protein